MSSQTPDKPEPGYRVERDTMGEVRVPEEALHGAQTQRAVENFPVSGLRFPPRFVHSLGLIKAACAAVNREMGLLDEEVAKAIEAAAAAVARGEHDGQFPIDIFQTGSGTSTNMNANEVIATLASRALGRRVHPNDHVNRSQSSNDVIPTAMHLSAYQEAEEVLLPGLERLRETIEHKASQVDHVVKTGRTHLMDALPMRMSQELSGWSEQAGFCLKRIRSVLPEVAQLSIGGTAIGTGLNAPAGFGERVARHLAEATGLPFVVCRNPFAGLSGQQALVELSGSLKTTAVVLMKIANDLRWMNSGPFAGLGEISLPALQPGSSIMPAKVNPVIPEAVTMACAQVMGNDVTIAVAGQSGSFQLNVMLPVIAYNLLQSIQLLGHSATLLAEKAIRGFQVNEERIKDAVERNPILVTALNLKIGYERAAEIAKRAVTEGRTVREVALEMTSLTGEELDRLLDPKALTEGGIPG